MGSLTHVEKMRLERVLGMSSGYVLSFSNRTFAEFFNDVLEVDIYDSMYDYGSGSKANRMRAFWNVAPDDQILRVMEALLDGWDVYVGGECPPDALNVISTINTRLSKATPANTVQESVTRVEDIQFLAALTFPGTQRGFVSRVFKHLHATLGPDKVFYDKAYQAQLAKPDLDTLLQRIYRYQSRLVVVLLSADYATSDWCGLEWRAIRDIIKAKDRDRVMFVRFDDAEVDGTFSIDGYIDATQHDESEIATFILQRIALCSPEPQMET